MATGFVPSSRVDCCLLLYVQRYPVSWKGRPIFFPYLVLLIISLLDLISSVHIILSIISCLLNNFKVTPHSAGCFWQ